MAQSDTSRSGTSAVGEGSTQGSNESASTQLDGRPPHSRHSSGMRQRTWAVRRKDDPMIARAAGGEARRRRILLAGI